MTTLDKNTELLQLTITTTDEDLSDLEPLGLSGRFVAIEITTPLCEHHQAELLAMALHKVASSKHLKKDPIIAALCSFPYTEIAEAKLRIAAAEGSESK